MASHTVFQAKTQLNIFLLNRCPRIMRTNLLPSTTKRSLVFSITGCHLRLGSGWAWIGWWCYWRGRRASRRSSSSPPSGQDMTYNQLLMPLWINKSVASYVLIKLVDTACRLRGCHLPLSNVSPTPAAPKQTAAAGVEPGIWTGGNSRIIVIYYTQRIAQNAIEKTAIFAPKIWCLQAGNSKMATYFIFLQPLKHYLKRVGCSSHSK